jgi:hypothetical protein
VPRRQLLDAAEGRAARHVLQGEVGVERSRIELARDAGEAEQRLHLRGERDRPVRQARPEERLLADAVAREDEPLAAGIPQREREHAAEPLDEVDAVLLVQVRDHRRVARAAHLVTGQLAAQLAEVVELAVEDGGHVARLIRHRLAARRQVDHLQAPVPEDAAAELVDAALVWPAVDERGVHTLDERRVGAARGREQSADPAHRRSSCTSWTRSLSSHVTSSARSTTAAGLRSPRCRPRGPAASRSRR